MIQARIDRMKELDQLVVKNASILGMSFPRVMLKAILPSSTTEDILRKALRRMADSGIFVCASRWKAASAKASILKESNKGDKNVCECPNENGATVERPLYECKYMRFQSASTQETAYQMYLESNK